MCAYALTPESVGVDNCQEVEMPRPKKQRGAPIKRTLPEPLDGVSMDTLAETVLKVKPKGWPETNKKSQ